MKAPKRRHRIGGKRVLFVHQSSDMYGSDRVLIEIADALLHAGGHPVVVVPGDGPLVPALLARGLEVHSVQEDQVLKLSRQMLSPAGLLRLATAVPRALRTLDRIVDGREIDWVHSNTLAVLGGALWARRHRVEHIWHLHEMVSRPRVVAAALPWLVRLFADLVVCNSKATRQWLLEAQPRLAGRTEVIWNGVNDIQAGANSARVDAPIGHDLATAFRSEGSPHAVGLIGRINRMKGHETLLEAAELLHTTGRRDFTLVFIGSAPPGQEHFTQSLRERIARSPIAHRVQLRDYMPDVSAAYAALDVVCVPSTEAEGFGLVAIEAMAARLPVLASRIGGLPEIVEHGQTGLLHAPSRAAELARHLDLLLSDKQWRAELGAAGRARFESDFTMRAMTRRFLELFSLPQRVAARSPEPR